MTRLTLLKSGAVSEQSIQRALFDWIRLYPALKYIIMHIPNEGKRSPQYGSKLRSQGLTPGVWDVFIASAQHGFIGAWIELKSANGKLTPYQEEFGVVMAEQGYFTAVCKSLDDAINTVKWYMFHNGVCSTRMAHHH